MRRLAVTSPLRMGALALLLLASAARAQEAQPSVLSIVHEDGLGDWFVLRSVELRLDDAPLPLPSLPPEGTRGRTLPLYESPLSPGRHLLDYHFTYSGSPGLFFSYVEGYRFHMRGRLVLDVEPGMEVAVQTVAAERPGWDRSWSERPAFVLEAVPRRVVAEAIVGRVDRERTPQQEAAVASGPAVGPTPATPPSCGPVTVYFASGNTQLDAEGHATLERLVGCLEPGARLELVGHSDTRGEAGINVRLGMGRAQTVAGQLRALGLTAEQLRLTTVGGEQPACYGDQETCHRRNRRVVVDVVVDVLPAPAATDGR